PPGPRARRCAAPGRGAARRPRLDGRRGCVGRELGLWLGIWLGDRRRRGRRAPRRAHRAPRVRRREPGERGHALRRPADGPPGADSLPAQVARFVALLEAGTDPGALAGELGQAVLEPAIPDLGPEVTRLVIVPDGPLHRLPWDALRLADGRRVVERYAVSVAPSAAVVAALWRRARSADGPVRLLALGDPLFTGLRSAFDDTGGLPRLEASASEVQLVARYATEAEVRVREAASAAWLKHAPLDRFRVMHFATHALVDEATAARTALALAASEGES